MNIAYVTEDQRWLNNRMFDEGSEWNANDVLSRYAALREYLAGRGHDINTCDMYSSIDEVEIWLVQEPTPGTVKFVTDNRIEPSRVLFFLHEPPVVNPWGWEYISSNQGLYKAILTWESDIADTDRKFFHYHFPVRFDVSKYDHYRQKGKKNLCLIMHSNKASAIAGELYSFRRQVLKYFEERGDHLLDLFGYGWNSNSHPSPFFTSLYKGTTDDKSETYSEYYYSFCIDNCIMPGYITYDPLVSMAAGTVPIYIPMPDSTRYIPEDTFINLLKFKSLDDLVVHLKSLIDSGEYEKYRERGWAFLNSEKYYPFTVPKFCEDVYAAVDYLAGELKSADRVKDFWISPDEASKRLNPHFVKLLPMNGGIVSRQADPFDLLNARRFDLMPKYLYVKHRDMGVDSQWARDLYDEHIRVFNGYDERDGTGKKGIEAFLSSFDETIDTVRREGLNPEKSMIPVTHGNTIIEGSHRLAACLYYKKPVHVLSFPSGLYDYPANFFKQRGMSEASMDACAYEYCKLKENTRIVLLFPSAVGGDDQVRQILARFGAIYYEKEVRLENNGPVLLMTQVYKGEPWLGDVTSNFGGAQAKAHACFRSDAPLRVFVVDMQNPEHLVTAKNEIRAIYGIGNHSVHINDTHEETIRIAQALLNENSVHFLNHARPRPLERFYPNLVSYMNMLEHTPEDRENYCVGGSAVMAAYGIRDARDIDYLHFGRELSPPNPEISSHNKEIGHYPTTRDDIIFNPLNHFYFDGVKYASLEVIRQLKARRGEEKDRRDVALMDEFSGASAPLTTVGIIFSKDRAMQLECTLRSFYLHCRDAGMVKMKVLYTTSDQKHQNQYDRLKNEYPAVEFIRETEFRKNLFSTFTGAAGTLFLVDDNIFVQDFSMALVMKSLQEQPSALGFSLRLGKNITYSYMMDRPHSFPEFTPLPGNLLLYDWTTVDQGFGYPLEVSSSVYRASEMVPYLSRLDFRNPNTLEAVMDANKKFFSEARRHLLCFETGVTFCSPLNKVQSVYVHNKSGTDEGYSPEKLAEMFDNGYRVDVDQLSGFVPYSYHQEVDLPFIHMSATSPGPAPESPLVSIIILNHNRLEDLKLCLESIGRHTPERHDIIVVDNASTDGSREYLRSLDNIILVENSENIGCPPARAQAMALAKGDFILFLDNDTVVTPGWMTSLMGYAMAEPTVGMIGPRSNYVSGKQLVPDVPYKDLAGLDEFARDFAGRDRGHLSQTTRLVGFCMFIRREVIEKIGNIDASFGKFGFEDDDYTWRARIAGFLTVIANDVFVHHTGGPQGRGDNQYNELLGKAWDVFKKKWGLPPDLKYGAQFDLQGILTRPFDRQKHYIPLPDRKEVLKLVHAGSTIMTAPPEPVEDESLRRKNLALAVDILVDRIKAFPDERRVYYLLAELVVEDRRFEEAAELLDAMPEALKNDLRWYELAGCCAMEMEDDEEAERCAERALALDGLSAKALNMKGALALKRNMPADAERFFARAMEAAPTYGESYSNLGVLKWSDGRQEEALDLLEKAVVLSPSSVDAAENYYAAVESLAAFERAEAVLGKLAAENPLNEKIGTLMADIRARLAQGVVNAGRR